MFAVRHIVDTESSAKHEARRNAPHSLGSSGGCALMNTVMKLRYA